MRGAGRRGSRGPATRRRQVVGAGGSFCEIQALNFEDDVVEMGHDGPAHLAVSSRDPLLRGLGVYHGKRGWGVSVEFDVRHGPVTLLGLAQDADGVFAAGHELFDQQFAGITRGQSSPPRRSVRSHQTS